LRLFVERLKLFVVQTKEFFGSAKGFAGFLLRPTREVLLVRTLSLLFICFSALWSYLSFNMWIAPHLKPAHSEEEDEVAEGGEKKGGHGGEAAAEPAFSGSLIPKDIRDRQDGQLAEGHDLQEPGPKRGLASIQVNNIAIRRGFHYFPLDSISAGLKVEGQQQNVALISFEFEVDNYKAKEELRGRETEMRSLMISILAKYERDQLLGLKGKQLLKSEIMTEMNYHLKNGRVVDVLFSSFTIR
jgi:hypothetical protein